MTKPQSWTIAILLAILTMSASINAQDGAGSVWDGVFTDEQATRGEITYEQECATCHLADLLGDGIAPALNLNDLATNASLAPKDPASEGLPVSPAELQELDDIVNQVLQWHMANGGVV